MNTQANTLPPTDGNPGGATAMDTPEDVSPRTNNVPDDTAPSIRSSAMLTELNISQWTARKKDGRASKEVTDKNNAETGVANVHKNMMHKCVELDAVHKLTGNLRNIHYAMTMPWSDAGQRLMPTAQYFKYHQTMTDLENQWHNKVSAFLSSYQWAKSQAQAKQGDLYNSSDYPTLAQVERKFGFRLAYIELPDGGDWRLDINNEAMAEVRANYKDHYSRQLTNALNDVWTRLHTALTRMSSQLSYKADGKKEIFKDSLVGNVMDMVELLGVCNITGDSQMTALKDELSGAMYGVTADVLREDTFTRDHTKRNIDQIIAKLPSLEV